MVSWIIVLIGCITVFKQQDKILGIDFRGGEEIVASFSEEISSEDLNSLFEKSDDSIGEVQHVYRSEIGSGESSKKLVLQTETAKSRMALDLINNLSQIQTCKKKE